MTYLISLIFLLKGGNIFTNKGQVPSNNRFIRIIIKGCTNKKFKKYFYSLLIDKIQPVAKSIMFGEACSSVPIFKAKK